MYRLLWNYAFINKFTSMRSKIIFLWVDADGHFVCYDLIKSTWYFVFFYYVTRVAISVRTGARRIDNIPLWCVGKCKVRGWKILVLVLFFFFFKVDKPLTLIVSRSMAISRVRCSFSLYKTSICCCISTLGPRIRILSSSSNCRTIILCFCNRK